MPAPLRILAVGNMYPPHHQGGYELVWRSAMQRAIAAGHQVRVLVSVHRERGAWGDEDPDVHRTLRWYWDWEQHDFPRLSLRERLALERANARELAMHLRTFRPHVVTWWSMGHMSLSLIEQVRRTSTPAVFSIHNDWLVYSWEADQWMRVWPKHHPAFARAAQRLTGVPTSVAVDRAGLMLFNSEYTRRRAALAGIDTDGARVIHPGIDARFLDPLEPRDWGWELLYVGRIDRFKGVDTAVDALVLLPEQARLTIRGTGDPHYTRELQAQVSRLGLERRVRFQEFTAPDGVRDGYGSVDAVLFPVRGEEPWGLVPLEAMGVGRAVISTARGGTAEFIRDGVNGLVIPPDDPPALALAIRRLADDPRLRQQLLSGGRATAERHTAAEFDRQTLAAIEEAARGQPTRASQN